jgi:predicted acylesterase/phospholipase RssA
MSLNCGPARLPPSLLPGLGFSGSGFLLFYFFGVLASLLDSGIVTHLTPMAGSSGGAIAAVSAGCAGLAPATLLDKLIATSEGCRLQNECFVSVGET